MAEQESADSQSSAEDTGSAEDRVRHREWLASEVDAAEVVDDEGEVVGDDENDGNDESDGEDASVNSTEKALAAMAEAQHGAVAKAKADRAANEQKRKAKANDRQRQKNLSGSSIERHIPKGSVKKMELVWLKAFDEHYPDFTPAKWWTLSGAEGKRRPGKEAGLVSQLVQMYSVSDIEKSLRWAVASWGVIQTKFKNVPAVPSIGFLYSFRESLVPEALLGNERATVEAELKAWFDANPNSAKGPPIELLERMKAAKARG